MLYRLGDLSPIVHPTAWVAENAAVIGDVELKEDVSIWFGVVLRGDVRKIRVGARSNVQDNSVLHAGVTIGEDCLIAHLCLVHGAVLGNGVFIGNGAVVYDRVEIGDGAFIGAGALVTPGTKVPSNTLMLGAPAQPAGPVTEAQRRQAVNLADSYLKNARRYRAEMVRIV